VEGERGALGEGEKEEKRQRRDSPFSTPPAFARSAYTDSKSWLEGSYASLKGGYGEKARKVASSFARKRLTKCRHGSYDPPDVPSVRVWLR